MKFYKLLSTAVVILGLTASTAIAAPDTVNSESAPKKTISQKFDFKGKGCGHKCDDTWEKDPVKALESKKQKVQEMVKEGKITKEKADEINTRIDSRIKEVQEFNKLTTQQKKEKLLSRHKEFVENKVKEGKLTKEKADELTKKFTEKLEKWDGTGYPRFHDGKHKFHKDKSMEKQ